MSDDDERAGENKELVSPDPDQRNWRGILIAVLVILIVFSLIIVAIILVTPKDEDKDLGEPFTMEDIQNRDYQPRMFSASWNTDKNIFTYKSKEDEIMEYDVEHNKTTVIMNNSTLRQYNTDMFFVSQDRNFVLLAYEVEMVYRHSFKAKYKIYDRNSNNPKGKVINFPTSHKTSIWDDRKLQFAGWSPTGSSLTFIYDNNMYFQSGPYSTYTIVTNDGEENSIYNGLPDWLYEEEIFHSNKAHWVSPEADYICFAKIDDTNVPRYRFPDYGDGTSAYVDIREIPYPKAGAEGPVNPAIQLHIATTSNPNIGHKQLLPPAEFSQIEHYVMGVVWQDKDHVLVTWSNRAQTMSIVLACSAMGDCAESLLETNHEGRGWVQIPKPIFLQGDRSYLTVLPQQDAHHGYWRHIALVTSHIRRPNSKSYITHGTWDVLEVLAVDQPKSQAYFLGNGGDTKNRHLYSVKIPEISHRYNWPRCLTCDLDAECQYVSAYFSNDGQYYILHCEGPGVPTFTLRSTVDDRAIVLEDNAELKARLDKKALPIVEYHDIETPDGDIISAKVLLPRVLKKEQILLYPLLVHTYGAPGTQRVTQQFRVGWESNLVSNQNVIYAIIDGRGSPGRGDRYMHANYRGLGTLEVEDQITGGRFFRDNFTFVDKERMAIWGWSYGGFVTAHAMGDPDNIFPCGVAVAPVTDWRYYDTAYSERYMGFAHDDNYRGYDDANVSRKAEFFLGKKILIIHGTADDNVHFQHTAQFLKALTQAGVDFRIQIYPDENHKLDGPRIQVHMYRTIGNFLKETCWDGGNPRMLETEEEEAEGKNV